MPSKNEIVQTMMDVEITPSFPKQELAKKTSLGIPLAELAVGGAAFASLFDVFRTVTQTIDIPMDGLYKFTSRGYGGGPTPLHDGSGFISSIVHEGKGVVGQGAFVPAEGLTMSVTTTMPIDPATLAIAIALAEVNQKLDAIQATQEEVLEFLTEDKRAEIRGDAKTLADTLNDFKFNSDNDTWRGTRHQEVLDIKRKAEQHIEFYRAQIEKKAAENGFLQSGKKVAKKRAELIDYLGQYQSALYLLGFATFLDVIFAENFDKAYLDHVDSKLSAYGIEYRQAYTDAYNQLEQDASSSIDGALIEGVASASSFLGKAMSKIPLLEKSPADEVLQDAGTSLKDFNERRQERALEELAMRRDNSILPFIDNVRTIRKLYNDESILYLDGDTLYYSLGDAL